MRAADELTFAEQIAAHEQLERDPSYTNTGYDPMIDCDHRAIEHNRRAAEQDVCHLQQIGADRRRVEAAQATLATYRRGAQTVAVGAHRARSGLSGARRRPGARRPARRPGSPPSDDSGEPGEPPRRPVPSRERGADRASLAQLALCLHERAIDLAARPLTGEEQLTLPLVLLHISLAVDTLEQQLYEHEHYSEALIERLREATC